MISPNRGDRTTLRVQVPPRTPGLCRSEPRNHDRQGLDTGLIPGIAYASLMSAANRSAARFWSPGMTLLLPENHPCWWEPMHGRGRCCARWRLAEARALGNAGAWGSTVLLRLAYLGVTNVFALLRLV